MNKHIPNLITLANLYCGTLALLAIFNNNYGLTLLWVVVACVLDFFDGFAARLLKVSSPLGLQLDSLADVVSFGVVPAMVMYKLLDYAAYNQILPYFGLLIAVSSAYRLAKFNIDTRQTTSFLGLPTPANALFIVSLGYVLQQNNFSLPAPFFTLLCITLLSSWILISEVPLFALKFKNFTLKDNLRKYVFLGVSALMLLLFQISGIPAIIVLYVLLSVLWKEPAQTNANEFENITGEAVNMQENEKNIKK